MEGTLTALPPPPPNAAAAWRHGRITRLIGEIALLLAADAAPARLAARIVILRELANDTLGQSHAPELTVDQLRRLRTTKNGESRAALRRSRSRWRLPGRPAK